MVVVAVSAVVAASVTVDVVEDEDVAEDEEDSTVVAAVVVYLGYLLSTYRGLPNVLIIMGLLVALYGFVTNQTTIGRRIYALGGNEKAARLSGLEVDRLKVAVYVISAVTAGLAGIVEVSYLSSAIANQGLGKELSVIAAAVIGGTALTGGEGTVLGVFVGTVILEVLRNGLVLLGTDAYWQGIFVGAVIILAVFIDQLRKGLWRR